MQERLHVPGKSDRVLLKDLAVLKSRRLRRNDRIRAMGEDDAGRLRLHAAFRRGRPPERFKSQTIESPWIVGQGNGGNRSNEAIQISEQRLDATPPVAA